jgi:hypothetical protein
MLHVCFCGLCGVMRGMLMVSSRGMRMMRRLFMSARLVVLRGLVMMPRRFFVVLCRMAVMGGGFLRHGCLLR